MNYSRKELIATDATMNQLRNSIHILASFMKKNGVSNTRDRLRIIGQNIARTYIRYWKPTETVNLSNLKDVITTIYQKILSSSVSIEILEVENLIRVQDYKCALCKYQYDDITIAGCEIILGLVSEIVTLISNDSHDSSSIFLEPFEVTESRAYGNKACVQVFKYEMRKGD